MFNLVMAPCTRLERLPSRVAALPCASNDREEALALLSEYVYQNISYNK